MHVINYEQFKELILQYKEFNDKVLEALYSEFGKKDIDNYFNKYFNSLEDDEITESFEKYSAFLRRRDAEEDKLNLFDEENDFDEEDKKQRNDKYSSSSVGDTIKFLLDNASKYPLMSEEMEYEQGINLKNGRNNLTIIKRDNEEFFVDAYNNQRKRTKEEVYPKLEIEKIFLSVKNEKHLEKLILLRKLPYKLNDENILSENGDIINIRKYLKLCNNGIVDISILKKEFPSLTFDNVDVLSPEELTEQLELLEKYIVAKFNFINRNLKLVISIAKRKYFNIIPLEDAIQIGNMGLFKAINKYDVERGNKFSTYATWWIRQIISREISNTGDLIRKPVHMGEKIKKYENFVNNFYFLNMREPSVEEITLNLGYNEKEITEIRLFSTEISSLDNRIKDDDTDDLYAIIPSSDPLIENTVVFSEMLNFILSVMKEKLTEREFEVLLNRNGLNEEQVYYTLEQLGNKMGITRERVRQIESKGLRKIQNRLRAMGIKEF